MEWGSINADNSFMKHVLIVPKPADKLITQKIKMLNYLSPWAWPLL